MSLTFSPRDLSVLTFALRRFIAEARDRHAEASQKTTAHYFKPEAGAAFYKDATDAEELLGRVLALAVAKEQAADAGVCLCPQHGSWIAADDVNRLTRRLDVAINGEAGAAKQASLCDVVAQVESQATKRGAGAEGAIAWRFFIANDIVAEQHWTAWSNDTWFRDLCERLGHKAEYAYAGPRPCTCHPDDSPPVPCAKKYALTDCKAAGDNAEHVRLLERLRGALGAFGSGPANDADIAALTAAIAALSAPKAEAVEGGAVFRMRFGAGKIGVFTGTYEGDPAVLLYDAPKQGSVGDEVSHSDDMALRCALTFPTDAQAQAVMNALAPAVPSDLPPTGWVRNTDGKWEVRIGGACPANRSGGYSTPWTAIYDTPTAQLAFATPPRSEESAGEAFGIALKPTSVLDALRQTWKRWGYTEYEMKARAVDSSTDISLLWDAGKLRLPTHSSAPASGAVTEAKYHELLYAVARAWPNETRHETALRYIREAESGWGPATAALAQGGKP